MSQPLVRLGPETAGPLAPAIAALVERGALRRPGVALSLAGTVFELRFREGWTPVAIHFHGDLIEVRDGPAHNPAVTVEAALPDLVGMLSSPLPAGLPRPGALARMLSGRVRVVGRRVFAMRFVSLLALDTPRAEVLR